MMSLESRYLAACQAGDVIEAARLARLMQRLDAQARAYGRAQRGEV